MTQIFRLYRSHEAMNATQVLKTSKSVSSGVIGIFGTFSNILSLSYFLRDDSPGGVGTKLLMLLNIFDLLVCVSSTSVVLLDNVEASPHIITATNISRLLFRITTQCTGFTTCLLSITRTISFHCPFYQLNQVAVGVAAAVHTTLISTINIVVLLLFWFSSDDSYVPLIALQAMNCTELTILSIIFVLVVCSNTISVVKLVSQEQEGEIRRATITVLILSVLFCVFNFSFIAVLGCIVVNVRLSEVVNWMTLWLALPLNSACNPLVYILRKQPMRFYIKQTFKKICVCRKVNYTTKLLARYTAYSGMSRKGSVASAANNISRSNSFAPHQTTL